MLADGGKRLELLGERVVGAGAGRDPAVRKHAVAPEEEDEAAREGIRTCRAGLRRMCHELEPRQANANGGTTKDAAQEPST